VHARTREIPDRQNLRVDDSKTPVSVGDVDGENDNVHLMQFLHGMTHIVTDTYVRIVMCV